jgi:hypothetical protein
MRIFNIDLHISVIADIKNVLESMGHSVTSWSLSNSTAIMGQKKASVDCIKNEEGHPESWHRIGPEMGDRFYQRYKAELGHYDAFLVTYAPALSLLFARFDKPIIIVAPVRYEVPFTKDPPRWLQFNQFLRDRFDAGRLVLAANNRFDQQYGELLVGRPWRHIPSYCGYTATTYHRKRDVFLYSSRLENYAQYIGGRALPNVRLKHEALRGRYKWHDLTAFAGVIQIPYNVSTMSIFENYAQNMPMFFPTQEFMRHLRADHPEQVLCESTWMQTAKIGTRTPPELGVPLDNDPNNYSDPAVFAKWLPLCDFYDREWMPHLIYFDSFPELAVQLREADLDDVSGQMRQANVKRLESIKQIWADALRSICA